MSTPLIGHKRQIEYLNRVRERGTMAHAYLFHGPEHVGKLTIAKKLAEQLRADVVLLDREHSLVSEKETRKDIPIADIRELKRRFAYAAQGDTWRVAIINEAEKMNEEAANAFLKLLEEPGAYTLFILITPHRELLLPTIISRTQSIGFSAVPAKELEEYLASSQYPDSKKKEYALIANGRPGVLVSMLEDNAYAKEEFAFLKEMVALMKARTPSSLLAFASTLTADQGRRGRAIEYLVRGLRKELLQHASDYPTVSRTSEKIKRINRMATILDTTNVNPKLVLDAIMLEMII